MTNPFHPTPDPRIEKLVTRVNQHTKQIHKLEQEQQVSQTEIDALTTAVGEVAKDLEADVTTIQSELDKLEGEINAGQPVTLGALQEAVAALDPRAKALGELVPTPKAP
jgi:peptidoglycan hydrolase CwlO-like protein